jgi:hypothetical protein
MGQYMDEEGHRPPSVNAYEFTTTMMSAGEKGDLPSISSERSWDEQATVKEVSVPELRTMQDIVNPHRVQELFHDPSTATRQDEGHSGDMVGKPNLPKVYEHKDGEQQVMDGNHRTVAAHRRGQMFMQARVIDHTRVDFSKPATRSGGPRLEGAPVPRTRDDLDDATAAELWNR